MNARTVRARLIATGVAMSALALAAGGHVAHADPQPAPPTGQSDQSEGRGTGLDVSAIAPAEKHTFEIIGDPEPGSAFRSAKIQVAPESASLEDHAPTPGQQGNVGSCVTWAVGYSGYGVLMDQQKIPGFPMAPMFLYAQISRGNDRGTYGKVALDMAVEQGIAPKSVYWQGDFDYSTQPTREQREKAAEYKLSGYQTLPVRGEQAKERIKQAISADMPVAIGIKVYSNFNRLPAGTASSYQYRPAGKAEGGHEMTIIGYDSRGVRIQNSWGPTWGDGGRVNFSWDYLLNSGDLLEANAMGKVNYTGGGDSEPRPSTTTEPSTSTTSATSTTSSTTAASTTSASTTGSTSASTTTAPTTTTTSTTTTPPAPRPRPKPRPAAYYFYWHGHLYYFDGYRVWYVW